MDLKDKYSNLISHFERSKQKDINDLKEAFRVTDKKVSETITASGKVLSKAFKIPKVKYRVIKHRCGDLDIIFEFDAESIKCLHCGEVIK